MGAMPFEAELLDRSWAKKVAGITIRVASPEDLVIMKAIPLRDQDARDIRALLDVYPKLDLRRVRRWVREFAQVLEMPEIAERLEALLAAPKIRQLRKATKKVRRRR